jgi:hypothetical protein
MLALSIPLSGQHWSTAVPVKLQPYQAFAQQALEPVACHTAFVSCQQACMKGFSPWTTGTHHSSRCNRMGAGAMQCWHRQLITPQQLEY